MIYVAGQVFGNFVFAMSLRLARGKQYHYLTVGTINYAVAAALAVSWAVLNGIPNLDLLVVVLGAINGLQYQISLVVLFSVVELVGIGITFGIIRLAIALPTLASIFLWGEQPAALQVVGLALAFVAAATAGRRRAPGGAQRARALFTDVECVAGGADSFWGRIYRGKSVFRVEHAGLSTALHCFRVRGCHPGRRVCVADSQTLSLGGLADRFATAQRRLGCDDGRSEPLSNCHAAPSAGDFAWYCRLSASRNCGIGDDLARRHGALWRAVRTSYGNRHRHFALCHRFHQCAMRTGARIRV